jgi:hypothetical protein
MNALPKRKRQVVGALALLGGFAVAGAAAAITGGFVAPLKGFTEVPVVSTSGIGVFTATVEDDGSLNYQLAYANMEAAVTQAHIHFGNAFEIGPVVAFLCTNLDPPDGLPAPPPCPEIEGTVSGNLTDADVGSGAEAQGLAAGDLDDLKRAMAAGAAYINVHTELHPAGEIRGQLSGGP